LKNGAKPSDVNDIDGIDSIETEPSIDTRDPEQLDVATQRRSSVRAAGVAPEKLGNKNSLGRARQR
jgi:hypothetical protein